MDEAHEIVTEDFAEDFVDLSSLVLAAETFAKLPSLGVVCSSFRS